MLHSRYFTHNHTPTHVIVLLAVLLTIKKGYYAIIINWLAATGFISGIKAATVVVVVFVLFVGFLAVKLGVLQELNLYCSGIKHDLKTVELSIMKMER